MTTDAAPSTAAKPRRRRRRRWRRYVLAILALSGFALYLGRGYVLPAVARFLDVSEPPRAVDYVLVLGGGTETRPFAAAALYEVGLVNKVLITATTRGPAVHEKMSLPEEQLTRRVLTSAGVSDRDIVVLNGICDSTRDEARALGRFLEEHPGSSVGVITSPFHTRRTRMLFRKALGDKADALHFFAAPIDGFDASNWWRFEAGFLAYTNEYAKLVAYTLGY